MRLLGSVTKFFAGASVVDFRTQLSCKRHELPVSRNTRLVQLTLADHVSR